MNGWPVSRANRNRGRYVIIPAPSQETRELRPGILTPMGQPDLLVTVAFRVKLSLYCEVAGLWLWRQIL